MLIIVKFVEFLDQITTYIMTTIPKLFSTLDVIDYGYWPMGPPEEPGEEPEEEPEEEIPIAEPVEEATQEMVALHTEEEGEESDYEDEGEALTQALRNMVMEE